MTENGTAQRFVNINDVFYTDAPEKASQRYEEALKIRFLRRPSLYEVINEDPLMLVVRDSEEEVRRLTVVLREYFGDRVYLANSKPFFIDINHPGVSKGAALLDLCQRLGISPAEVIAIGDGWNDREMLALAGLGAVVANAPEALKQTADYVCDNPSYRGVIEVIERFIN